MRKTLKNHRREKGIALLFTLGILGLLTVLALSFASSAMLERKAAQYNSGASSARILAQAGLNRAIAAMTIYKTANYENFDQLISHCTSAIDPINYLTFDQLYKMNTMADGTSSFFNPNTYLKTDANAIHWIYVNNGGTTSSPATYELTGRFAYTVTPAGGRLDPAACVESGKDESLSRTIGDAVNYVPRVGKSPSEIYIGDLEPAFASFLTLADVQKFSWNPPGTYNGTSWASYDSLFAPANLNVTSIMKKLKWQWDWFKAGADVDSSREGYWKDLNSDGKKAADGNEEFHRFNLARTDWDTGVITVDMLMGVSSTTPFAISSPATLSVPTTGIEWFSNSALNTGTFSSSANRTKQVAANLIDYCDIDSVPTSNIAPATWNADVPEYTGNEKTPYINEFEIEGISGSAAITSVTAGPDDDSNGSPDYYLYSGAAFTIDFGSLIGEVIKIYDDDLNGTDDLGTCNMYIKDFSATVNYTDVDGGSHNELVTFSAVPVLTFGSNTNRYTKNSNAVASPSSWSFNSALTSSTGLTSCTVSIDSVVFSQIHIYLETAAGNVDYATLPSATLQGAGGNPLVSLTATTSSDISSAFTPTMMDWQTHDPRQNLNIADWTSSSSAVSMEAQNTDLDTEPQSNGDCEQIDLLTGSGRLVSTAYIRNAPMKSPWELGAIHRGAKWETINLKKRSGTSFGSGSYSDGDAVLLDEIKMVSTDQTPGLINLKSSKEVIVSNNDTNNNAVLRCLFSGICVDANYMNVDSVNPAGTVLSTDNANTIAKNVKTYMESNFCKNRSQVVNTTCLTDGSVVGQTTDAAKEAIIGKSLALTVLEPSSTFKVVVLAQTLKDVGGPYDASLTATSSLTSDIRLSKDFDGNGSYSSSALTSDDAKKRTGFAWYNPFTDNFAFFNKDDSANFADNMSILESSRPCTKGRYEVGYDQITGEQKIVAILKYDSTSKRWMVLSYEIISE